MGPDKRTRVTDSEPNVLYPNADGADRSDRGISRRRALTGTVAAGVAASAGCVGTDSGEDSRRQPTVFVFNTGDGTASLIDPTTDEVVETRDIGRSSSFPSNQYTPSLTDETGDPLWINAGRGVQALTVGSLTEASVVETGSGANWVEQSPDGRHVIVSAREPSHRQFRIDGDPASETFGEVTGELDRTDEGGRGDRAGPGPCDVTIHPNGQYAYVPDIFGDTLTVLSIAPFEIVEQIAVEPVGTGPARPWMGTVSPDGETLLIEHSEGGSGTESLWDLSDPSRPVETGRLTGSDGLGRRPLTSEIGPESETGYVFTPGSNDITVVDLGSGTVRDRIDLGGAAFVGTWNPSHTKLYVPVQTDDSVAVVDPETEAVVDRLAVGANPYGATAARVRPASDSLASMRATLAQLGLRGEQATTTYCIGNCACGHEL